MKTKTIANSVKTREDIWNKCKDLLDQCYHYKYICENVGISINMFYNLIHLHNYTKEYKSIQRKRYMDKSINTDRYKIIKEMLINGSNYKEIGSELGVTKGRIRQLARKWNLSQYYIRNK